MPWRSVVGQDAVREREAVPALAEHSTDIIARFDRSLRHIYANPAIARHRQAAKRQSARPTGNWVS